MSAQSQSKPNKFEVVKRIVETISNELDAIERSAQAAHEAATHEESRSEDSHDTRSIEAGYLAGAQASRGADLKKLLIVYRELSIRDFLPGESAAVGALVRATLDEKPGWYFIVGAGAAGLTIEQGGARVQVVTVRSPLGEALIGRKAGESTELESQRGSIEIEVLEVN